MKITSIEVRALRSGGNYDNDSITVRAELGEGDDWHSRYKELRLSATRLIEEAAREEENRERVVALSERLKELDEVVEERKLAIRKLKAFFDGHPEVIEEYQERTGETLLDFEHSDWWF